MSPARTIRGCDVKYCNLVAVPSGDLLSVGSLRLASGFGTDGTGAYSVILTVYKLKLVLSSTHSHSTCSSGGPRGRAEPMAMAHRRDIAGPRWMQDRLVLTVQTSALCCLALNRDHHLVIHCLQHRKLE